jgi:hypothetical protein
MTSQEKDNSICCPQFDPAPWDNQVIEWQDKKFVKDHVFTLLFMPVNFSKVIKRLNEKADKAGANIPNWLCLSDHTSKWNMDLYLAVDKDVPNADNITMSGKFYSKVYEGAFKDTGKWHKDFENFAQSKNLQVKNTFMWYTTCPKCAKKYGENYVVIIALIE